MYMSMIIMYVPKNTCQYESYHPFFASTKKGGELLWVSSSQLDEPMDSPRCWSAHEFPEIQDLEDFQVKLSVHFCGGGWIVLDDLQNFVHFQTL